MLLKRFSSHFPLNSGACSSSFSESITLVNRVVAQATDSATSTSNGVEKHDKCSEMNNLNKKNEDCKNKEQETGALKKEVSEDKEQKVDILNKKEELQGKKTDAKTDNIST